MLSPDRHWLATVEDVDREPVMTTLRNLLEPVPAIAVNGWPLFSPDGRWVALRNHATDSPGTVRIGDLTRPDLARDLTSVDLSAYSGQRLVSVLANGDLVLSPAAGGTALEFSIVDPSTGLERRHVRVDLAGYLSPDELAGKAFVDELLALDGAPEPVSFTVDGLALYQTTVQDGPGGLEADRTRILRGDVLVIDLGTERVRERWVLPEPRLVPAELGPGTTDHSESWWLKEVLPDGLLLVHAEPQRLLALELYRPATGELFLVTDLTSLPSAKD
jgi:hypothetical protein